MMSDNPFEPPHSMEPRRARSWWGAMFGERDRQPPEPQCLLDDIAHAVHAARTTDPFRNPPLRRNWWSRRIRPPSRTICKSLWLDKQIDAPKFVAAWDAFCLALGFSIPKPTIDEDGQFCMCETRWTIQHVVDEMTRAGVLGDRIHPGIVTSQQWVNAQVFAGVQSVIVMQLGVAKEEVYRSARFVEDLGAD